MKQNEKVSQRKLLCSPRAGNGWRDGLVDGGTMTLGEIVQGQSGWNLFWDGVCFGAVDVARVSADRGGSGLS